MSFKPEVFVEGKWSQNSLVFATEDEAKAKARELMSRWTLVQDSRAVESADVVNYTYLPGADGARELKQVQ